MSSSKQESIEALMRMKTEVDALFKKKAAKSQQSSTNSSSSSNNNASSTTNGTYSSESASGSYDNGPSSSPNVPPAMYRRQSSAGGFTHMGPAGYGYGQGVESTSAGSFASPSSYASSNSAAHGGTDSSYSSRMQHHADASRDAYDIRLSSMSIGEVRKELERFGASTAGCLERSDFTALLKSVWLRRDRHFDEQRAREEQKKKDEEAARVAREAREAQRKKEREAQLATEKAQEVEAAKIIREVEMWAHNKPLYVMLNEINGERSLKRFDTFAVVSKAYKRAILQIHPDKHMNDHGKFVRATEMFKYVNEAYQAYRKQVDQ